MRILMTNKVTSRMIKPTVKGAMFEVQLSLLLLSVFITIYLLKTLHTILGNYFKHSLSITHNHLYICTRINKMSKYSFMGEGIIF